MRARSSSNDASVSGHLGASLPDSRDRQPFTLSVAIWICALNGSMSAVRRWVRKFLASNFFALACASALSNHTSMLVSIRTKIGTLAECIEIGIGPPSGIGWSAEPEGFLSTLLALAAAAEGAEPEEGVRRRPAATRAAVGQVRVAPRPARLALAHRAVTHERAQLARAGAPRAVPDRLGVGARRAAVALEAAGVAPGAGGPLRQHAALAVPADQREARDLREGVLRAAAPRAQAHRLGDRPVAAVAAVAQAERAAVAALEQLHADRERCRGG